MRKQRINAGQMTAKLEKYVFENGCAVRESEFRARLTVKPQRCVFSRLGRGSDETVELTFYSRKGITRGNILKADGIWLAPGFVAETDNKLYSYALCGRCRLIRCRATSLNVEFDAHYHRASSESSDERIFDAVICEKYVGAEEEEHFSESNEEYVLIYPKGVDLMLMDVIETQQGTFTVQRLSSGEYMDEAVISERGDI